MWVARHIMWQLSVIVNREKSIEWHSKVGRLPWLTDGSKRVIPSNSVIKIKETNEREQLRLTQTFEVDLRSANAAALKPRMTITIFNNLIQAFINHFIRSTPSHLKSCNLPCPCLKMWRSPCRNLPTLLKIWTMYIHFQSDAHRYPTQGLHLWIFCVW